MFIFREDTNANNVDHPKSVEVLMQMELALNIIESERDTLADMNDNLFCKVKTMEQLLYDDIIRCQQYFSNQENESLGRDLYIEITGRYDSIINGFGQGLYSYFPEQHFYDQDISISTVNHNLKLLLQKMISYQAKNYSTPEQERKLVKRIMSNKVFIVHGHDIYAKSEMARTLERGGFEAIILHEQASAGKTVIEKIEDNTDVAFAVVLYTPCDVGRAKEGKIDDERSRARQNVVFEHGYLIGKLGRERVCALVKDDIETPGDISGVVYITMNDAGAWKMELAKEIKNAGLQVDMNKFWS
jgi:predicted nucleotide-binding protein